jgi:mannosyltransferase OCH1-like enzyme
LSRSSNISLVPRIVASTKNNSILYANFLSSTALQYRQHVYNTTNFKSYKNSRWDVYGSWQWKERYPNYGFLLIENFIESNKILKKVEFSKESKEIISLKEETDSCVNFESLSKKQASEELFLLVTKKSESSICNHEKLFKIENVMLNNSLSPRGKIPDIIHMTAKTNCLTAHVKKYVDEWRNIPNYSFFLHDDHAVERLFQQYEWPEFPLLKQITKCISNGAMKADLWRYLLLWKFGGVYTDLDNGIGKYFNNASFITDDMDALFEVERDRFPSQYFFAASPRHPIMYFALSIAIENMMNHAIYKTRQTMYITGPKATKVAMIAHTDTKHGYLLAGVYTGKSMRNITLIGSKIHARQHYFIKRDAAKDMKEAHLMKMNHYIDNAKNITKFLPKHSCRKELVLLG